MNKNWLAINMYIDAWLDCSNPYISIHNKFDDDVLVHFNAEKVEQLICEGDVVVEDLQSTDPSVQLDTITSLMAIQKGESIKQQILEVGASIKQRTAYSHTSKIRMKNWQGLNVHSLFPSPI